MHGLQVDWASHQAARYACETWHYSGSVPAGKLVKVGVWEQGKYIGVVLFGRGANHNMSKAYKLRQDQCCELVRVALTDHVAPVTRIIRLALSMLKRSNPGLRLVVSYADPEQGHHGGIYQAGNWIYAGRSSRSLRLKVGGKWIHGRTYDSLKKKPAIQGKRRADGKHIYLMPLDKVTKKAIAPLSQPYPKRNKQAMTETIGTAEGQHLPLRSTTTGMYYD